MIKFDIRTKLTVQFSIIASIILIVASASIYSFSARYTIDEFYKRLFDKGLNVVLLLIDEEKVDADLLLLIENNNPINLPEEEILIYNRDFELIFSKPQKITYKPTRNVLTQIAQDSLLKEYVGQRSVAGFEFKRNEETFLVLSSAVDVYGYSKLRNLRNTLFIVVLSCLIVFWFAGRIFARQALLPIKKIVDEVEQINIDNLKTPLKIEKEDEIGSLARTFNNMLFRIERAFFAQKNFVANASHELKTPLTAIRGQLEVSLMQERTLESYKKTIQSVLDEVVILGEVTNNLLLLAYADTFIKDEIFKPIRIDEVLWSVYHSEMNLKPEYIINIHISEAFDSEEKLMILGNDHLLRIAFTNIIDNACKYSKDNKVEVFLKPFEDSIHIVFKDRGKGIEEKDLPNVTELFYRGRKHPNIEGNGIGLSLVEKITSIHKGELHIKSTVYKGTEIELHFITHLQTH